MSSTADHDRPSAPIEIPGGVSEWVRTLCLALPEVTVREDASRTGARSTAYSFDIRRRSFCLLVARKSPTGSPVPLLVLRADSDERDALLSMGAPFFTPRAGGDRIGVWLTDGTDWEEIRELVTESYRRLAPKNLTALLGNSPSHHLTLEGVQPCRDALIPRQGEGTEPALERKPGIGQYVSMPKTPLLQPLQAHHAPEILAFELANRTYFTASISDRGDEYFLQFTEKYQALLARQETGLDAYYVVVGEDESVLGRFNLVDIEDDRAELGYRVAERAARRGLATAAVRYLGGLARSERGLRVLKARTTHENVASQKVLAKVGFVPVGAADVGGRPGTWWERSLTIDDLGVNDGIGDPHGV